jgi:hypothetical protein
VYAENSIKLSHNAHIGNSGDQKVETEDVVDLLGPTQTSMVPRSGPCRASSLVSLTSPPSKHYTINGTARFYNNIFGRQLQVCTQTYHFTSIRSRASVSKWGARNTSHDPS